jgi:hypothetical protein
MESTSLDAYYSFVAADRGELVYTAPRQLVQRKKRNRRPTGRTADGETERFALRSFIALSPTSGERLRRSAMNATHRHHLIPLLVRHQFVPRTVHHRPHAQFTATDWPFERLRRRIPGLHGRNASSYLCGPMPQYGPDDPGVHTGLQHGGRAVMPQIMESPTGQPARLGGDEPRIVDIAAFSAPRGCRKPGCRRSAALDAGIV